MGSQLNIDLRPKGYDEILGLEDQIKQIRSKIDSGDIPRAFLLTGPYGCGKTTLAHLISRSVQPWDFTGEPQIKEVNGANIRGIDAMRGIADKAGICPMNGKYAIVILDEAQQLTKDAQQVLLKEFEVPDSPTVWIICTTDPEKINKGVRDRCFAVLPVTGMGTENRRKLVERAAKHTNFEGDLKPFLAALTRARMVSPRVILQAFEVFNTGLTAEQAVQVAAVDAMPEFGGIALGVVWGKWETSYALRFIKEKDGTPRKYAAVTAQLFLLREKLNKRPKPETEEAEPTTQLDEVVVEAIVDGEATYTKTEAAEALRNITAKLLENFLIKGPDKPFDVGASGKAAEALKEIFVAPGNPGTEFSRTVGALFKINRLMQGGN